MTYWLLGNVYSRSTPSITNFYTENQRRNISRARIRKEAYDIRPKLPLGWGALSLSLPAPDPRMGTTYADHESEKIARAYESEDRKRGKVEKEVVGADSKRA